MNRNSSKSHIDATGGDWATAEQLRAHFNLPSLRTVTSLRKARKIPYTKFGYRTIRYSISACMVALAKLEIHEIGRAKEGGSK